MTRVELFVCMFGSLCDREGSSFLQLSNGCNNVTSHMTHLRPRALLIIVTHVLSYYMTPTNTNPYLRVTTLALLGLLSYNYKFHLRMYCTFPKTIKRKFFYSALILLLLLTLAMLLIKLH